MSELLPCPFCGGETEMDFNQHYLAFPDGRIRSQVAIYCTSCTAHMSCDPHEVHADRNMVAAELIAAWNRRIPDLTQVAREVEHRQTRKGEAEKVANAAPELLAALKELDASICEGFEIRENRTRNRLALIAARAAIAKATGARS